MPRTFKATVALIATLITVFLLTVVNVCQTNSAEEAVGQMRAQLEQQNEILAAIQKQLQTGVAVSGVGAGVSPGVPGKKWVDPYLAQIEREGNLLKVPTDDLIYDDAKFGGTLRRNLGDDPKGFNWVTENSVDVRELQWMIHSALARRDFSNPDNFVPELAYRIEANEDYTEYTIHLREGVMWQVPPVDATDKRFEWLREPREMTAEDVAFYFELVRDPQVEAGSIKNYYEDLEGVEVIDDHTLKVKWKRPVYHSMAYTLEAYPMPKWLYSRDESGELLPKETLGLKFNNHWASRYPIGTGPYSFVKYDKGVQLKLERSDSFWGEKPPIETIAYAIVKDPEQSYLKLKADELDITGVPPESYKRDIVEAKSGPFVEGTLGHKVIDRFAYYYIGWNADKPLFADRKVRLAMTHAMNRQQMIDKVFHGLGTIQTGSYYHKMDINDPTVEPYPFDLGKARALLDEAGWKDSNGDGIRDKVVDGQKVNFDFNILTYNSPTYRSMLNIFKEDLRKIGVRMNPQPVDWPTMQKKMDEKAFDAFTGGWGLDWLTDPYQLWHSSQADIPKGSNRVGFRHKRADEIIEELRVTFDDSERRALLRELHRIFHHEQPYTFFFSPKSVVAWQPRLQNVVFQQIRPQTYSLPWFIDPSVKKVEVGGGDDE